MTRLLRLHLGLTAALLAGVAIGAGDDAARSKQASAPPEEQQVACGASGVDVTIALAYNHNSLGKVAGTYMDLEFSTPLELPEESTTDELHKRMTNLMPPEYRIAPSKLPESRKLRFALTTTEPGIPPQDALKVRFDCPAGSRIRSSDLTCRTDQVVDASGLPMADTLGRQVRCVVRRVEPLDSLNVRSHP
jgi:hypothetical protein